MLNLRRPNGVIDIRGLISPGEKSVSDNSDPRP